VSEAVDFPPRHGTLQFRQQLEAAYRDALGRSASASFVDIEGTIVWTQKYQPGPTANLQVVQSADRVFRNEQGDPLPVVDIRDA
jgi:hypothetical protein